MSADRTGRHERSRGKRRAWTAAERRSRRGFVPAAGPRDRGTVLLMVLGVLALMAIIAVVYASVGRGDRISSTMAVRQQRIQNQVEEIAQYFADVLRRDANATYSQEDERPRQTSPNAPSATLRLEAWDAPYTDPMMVSQALDPVQQTTYPVQRDPAWRLRQRSGFHGFNPEGSYRDHWRDLAADSTSGTQPANRRDPRTPCDPFLASTEPTFRNRESMDWNWQSYGFDEDYLNLRDWRHISNFAPSGNFVNLWALRNNYRAESGFERDANNKPRLSSLLTLINPATGHSYPAHNSNQDPNANIPGPIRAGNLTSFVQLNRPADWTNDQIGLFRTVAELPTGTGAGSSPFGVDDPEYLPYQFADADGDGFYDSRFFELVDIFDAQNLRPVVNLTGRARLFVAARCVDLSALVNVNTASDFQFEPRRFYASSRPRTGGERADPLRPVDRPRNLRDAGGRPQPGPRETAPLAVESGDWLDHRFSVESSVVLPAGLTPADVDLQRLLRISDPYYTYTQGGAGVGYNALPQPPMGSGLDVLAGDYRKYDPSMQFRNQVIGNAAYQALWDARLATQRPDRRYILPQRIDPGQPNVPPFIDTLRVAQQRFRFYENFALRRDPGTVRESGTLNRYGLAFDESDELELRTFQGLNDPDNTSRLETTVAGRFADDPDLYTLSPLRDNRAAALERAGRDLPPRDLNNTPPNANDEYRKALLAAQIDVRRLLTTMSGARPIVDSPLVTMRTDRNGNPVAEEPTELSERAGTIQVDAARLVSGFVETGNFSFDRILNSNNDLPRTSDPCDFVDNQASPPFLLANIQRENTLDDIGWYEPRPDAEKRPWFYTALDNQAPPTGTFRNAQALGPTTGTAERGTDRPDEENYTVSRLDLMREAFRAYVDCLLPYSQWGTDAYQPARRDGPFPDAWERRAAADPSLDGLPLQPNLAYGGDPELALRSAAHMALNLRDAADVDRQVTLRNINGQWRWEHRDTHLPAAVSLDLTPQAVDRVTSRIGDWNNMPYPNSGGLSGFNEPDQRVWYSASNPSASYQRDLLYPWPKLNTDNRFDTTDDAVARARLARLPENIVSTGDPATTIAKRVNMFGIEPQPFISQVTALMLAVDTPYIGDSEFAAGTGGDKDYCTPPPTIPGQPPIIPTDCEITINVKRTTFDTLSGETNNPDFLCYLIAFQVTNPWDTDIVLEPEDPSDNANWYYFEYANRFYRLAPKDSAQPIDGLKRRIPESQRVLRAGQTKTFYATYPNSVREISDRIRVIQQAASRPPLSDPSPSTTEPVDEDGDPSGLQTTFARIAKHEFGEDCVNVAPMYPETSVAIGAKRVDGPRDTSHRLTNVDLFAISSSYTPGVTPLQDGPYGENRPDPCTNKRPLDDLPPISIDGAWTQESVSKIRSDPRRRVYLWRVMRDPDSVDGDASRLPSQLASASAGSVEDQIRRRWNWTGNDLLVDRLYDPSPIPYVAGLGTPAPVPAYTTAEDDELKRCANGALVQALIKPFNRRIDRLGANNSSNIYVNGTDALASAGSPYGSDNTGFTLASWVSITRPLNPPRPRGAVEGLGEDPDGRAPEGALPPWCMESRPDNVYTPGFRTLSSDQPDTDPIRRNWSLNTVRKFCGIRSDISYKSKGEEWHTPYYTRFQDFLDVHSRAQGTVSVADSSYSKYPRNYPTGNDNCIIPRFIDPEMSVRFADRRGAKTLPAYDPNNSTNTSNAKKGDPRQAFSIVEIDRRRSEFGAETDEFFGVANPPSWMKPRRFDEVAIEVHTLPPDATDSTEAQSTPSRALFSRVGDFLLPLAIGPSFDPAAGPDFVLANNLNAIGSEFYRRTAERDNQWMTLAEALALAADYYSGPQQKSFGVALQPPACTTTGGPIVNRNIYYRFARDTRAAYPQNTTPLIPRGDRGHLVLDAWSPYLDYNPNVDEYQWGRIDPGVASTLTARRDAPLGNGIPLALNILDKFRVSGLPGETRPKPSDPRRCIDSSNDRPLRTVGDGFSLAGRTAASGSASRLVPGKININTAPMAVLRVLPLVSPSIDLLDPNDDELFDGWLYDGRFDRPNEDHLALVTPRVVDGVFDGRNGGAAVNQPVPKVPANRLWKPETLAPLSEPWDIAASIDAYRSQSAQFTRRFNGQDPILVDYRDTREDVPTNPARSGRDDAFQINTADQTQGGLRDGPGIKSLGELMAIEMKRSTDPRVITRAGDEGRVVQGRGFPIDTQNSITRLAHDGASNRSLAIDSTGHKPARAAQVLGPEPWGGTDPGNPAPASSTIFANIPVADGADTIADDYDEKLSVANALLNTVTVRSDVFCIWFVVHGYTPEDCQVDDGFPLVPSIAKRYVMVVDRSNVATPTTKPRIVMLREVPMP